MDGWTECLDWPGIEQQKDHSQNHLVLQSRRNSLTVRQLTQRPNGPTVTALSISICEISDQPEEHVCVCVCVCVCVACSIFEHSTSTTKFDATLTFHGELSELGLPATSPRSPSLDARVSRCSQRDLCLPPRARSLDARESRYRLCDLCLPPTCRNLRCKPCKCEVCKYEYEYN